MKIYTFGREQYIQRPIEEVFSFFERPENLARITPPWLGFRIVTPTSIMMKLGAEFGYTISVMGIRMQWKSLISEYEPPFRFVDEQSSGPYAFWHHVHTFKQVDNGTLVGDEVRYAMPLGVLGTMAQRLAVKRQLESIFSYRSKVIGEMFG